MIQLRYAFLIGSLALLTACSEETPQADSTAQTTTTTTTVTTTTTTASQETTAETTQEEPAKTEETSEVEEAPKAEETAETEEKTEEVAATTEATTEAEPKEAEEPVRKTLAEIDQEAEEQETAQAGTEEETAAQTEQEATQEVTAQASESTRVTADNPDAILSPANTLQADTLAAARHDRSQSKIAYIGAWASSPSGCAQIDQDVYDGFAVITPQSVRMFEEICTIAAAPLTSNTSSIDAICKAEGETYPGKFVLEMLNGQNMKFKHEGTGGFELVRCNLPS